MIARIATIAKIDDRKSPIQVSIRTTFGNPEAILAIVGIPRYASGFQI